MSERSMKGRARRATGADVVRQVEAARAAAAAFESGRAPGHATPPGCAPGAR